MGGNVKMKRYLLSACVQELNKKKIGVPILDRRVTVFLAKDLEDAKDKIIAICGLLSPTSYDFTDVEIIREEYRLQIWKQNSDKITTILEISEVNENQIFTIG